MGTSELIQIGTCLVILAIEGYRARTASIERRAMDAMPRDEADRRFVSKAELNGQLRGVTQALVGVRGGLARCAKQIETLDSRVHDLAKKFH